MEEADWARIRTFAQPGLSNLSDYRVKVEMGAVESALFLQSLGELNPAPATIGEAHRLMFNQATTEAGKFRKMSDGAIQYGGWMAVEAQRIPIELERLSADFSDLVNEARSQEDKCAALAFYHARFMAIHPFQDGNGRVGRNILQSQAKALGLDFSIRSLAQDKPSYIQAMNEARKSNDLAPLMHIVAKCSGLSLDWDGPLPSHTKIHGRLMQGFDDVLPLAEERTLASTNTGRLPLPSQQIDGGMSFSR